MLHKSKYFIITSLQRETKPSPVIISQPRKMEKFGLVVLLSSQPCVTIRILQPTVHLFYILYENKSKIGIYVKFFIPDFKFESTFPVPTLDLYVCVTHRVRQRHEKQKRHNSAAHSPGIFIFLTDASFLRRRGVFLEVFPDVNRQAFKIQNIFKSNHHQIF